MIIYNEDFSKQYDYNDLDLIRGKLINIGEKIVYVACSEDEIIANLRNEREQRCFSIINRGTMFWENLWEKYSEEEKVKKQSELKKWYKDWLDVTITNKIPTKPDWLI